MSNATFLNDPHFANNTQYPQITIIGAGWSGLTCAYELLNMGFKVKILEASPNAGGRARSLTWNKNIIDNGQHLFIKGYEHTLELLKEISSNNTLPFIETPFHIKSKNLNQNFEFKILNNKFMPYFINLLFSLFKAQGFKIQDKIKILKFFIIFLCRNFNIKNDITVYNLLAKYNFSQEIIDTFFKPIVVSTMTTHIEQASAKVFLNILKKTFFTKKEHSNLLFTKIDLHTLFVQPLINKIISIGGTITYNALVQQITLSENKIQIQTIRSIDDCLTDIIVLATPPWQTSKIIENIPELNLLQQELSIFAFEPITNIYIEFEEPINSIAEPMIGIINGHTHWLFKNSAGNTHIACVVISSTTHELQNLTKEEIIQLIVQEIQQVYSLPKIINIKSIQEKRAAFSCTTKANESRPQQQTIVPNIFLCGDYTTIDYPATLEAAVISGKMAAKKIISSCKKI